MPKNSASKNRLLASLTPQELNRLLPEMEKFDLIPREKLFGTDERIEYVYFPEEGVVSLVSQMKDGSVMEIGTVGKEGMVGLPVFLGAVSTPLEAFTQVPGHALRLKTAAFKRALAERNGLQTKLQRYTQALFTQLAQSVACNRLHSLEQRCARWLLATADRVEKGQFKLTQEFLAQMLGVRRAGVNAVLQDFQRRGIIRYKQGVMEIRDRRKLEGASCECYAIVRREYESLTGKS